MVTRRMRFNINLFLCACLAMLVGCQTGGGFGRKELAGLRVHLEVPRDSLNKSEPVPIYRADPHFVNIQKEPILHESQIVDAVILDSLGSYTVQLTFDRKGTWLLENITSANPSRRLVIFGQWGEKPQTARWLAAPKITHRITDGKLTFTPDATREEAEQLVQGLTYVAKKIEKESHW